MTTKAVDIARVSARGSFNYMWGLVIATVISSIGTIFVGNQLGPDLYGLFNIALFVPNLVNWFRDWGINSAMVRYTAQYRAEGRLSEIRNVFATGLLFELSIGFILTIFTFALSNYLATVVFNRPITLLIQVASITIFAGGLINVATAAFTGFEEMKANSVMLICQSIIKTFLMIGLVLIGYGPLGAISGYTIAMLVAGGIGILLMAYLHKRRVNISDALEVKKYLKILIKYGMPICAITILSGILTHFFAFLLPLFYEGNTMIGNYQIATTFVVLIGFFSTPISAMLFPAFSKIDYKKDKELLKSIYQSSVKYASLIMVPIIFAIMSLAEPGINVLFTDYPYAAQYLALLSIPYLFVLFGQFVSGALLNGQGFQYVNLKRTIITVIIGFPLGYFLIMKYGVIGLIVTTIVQGIPSLILLLHFIKTKFGVSIDWYASAKILVASVIPAVITYLVVSNLNLSYLSPLTRLTSLLELTVGSVIFVIIWTASTVCLRVVNKSDLSILRATIGNIGVVGKLFNRVLDIAEKIIKS